MTCNGPCPGIASAFGRFAEHPRRAFYFLFGKGFPARRAKMAKSVPTGCRWAIGASSTTGSPIAAR
jgi:hypothetical protein